MTKEIKAYLSALEAEMKKDGCDYELILKALGKRIAFYQHERLVHLIITMTFAVLCVLSFTVAAENILFLALAALFLALEIPYVFHYYFLENSVQALQRTYFKVEEKLYGIS